MKKDKLQISLERLQHILESILMIEKYTDGFTESEFESNPLVQDAVLFHFSVIGEAIIHVDNELLERIKYPWYKVRSFRNIIAHEYFNIKMNAVWTIIIKDLPLLKSTVVELIENV